jgi:hypothetical protein
MTEQKDLEKPYQQDQREINRLQQELRRKDKALAEAAALLPGSPGELPPEAPTDPKVTISRHTAPVIQPPPVHRANEQTSQAAAGRSAPEAHDRGDAFAVIAGASHAAMRLGGGLGCG